MDIIKANESARMLRAAKTQYGCEVAKFANFVEHSGKMLGPEVIDRYLAKLKKEKRQTSTGAEVGYSASWYNRHLKAIKAASRWALDHWSEQSTQQLSERDYRVAEKYLKGLKYVRPKKGIAKVDRVPTTEELKAILDKSDKKLRLIIRFLAESGCRISEALGAEVGRARRGVRVTYITIVGKGSKERDIRITTPLFDEIRQEFDGQYYLFEHGGKPYSRTATTNRIKQIAEVATGKPTTAHMLRHYKGTMLSEKLGISKGASELGITVGVFKNHYDHSSVSEEEFLSTLEDITSQKPDHFLRRKDTGEIVPVYADGDQNGPIKNDPK